VGESHDPRLEDVRQRLRALGYLDASLDRFVLGSTRATQQPLSVALNASLRIGIVAAVLLGPASAIGLAARMPGLITRFSDALLAALYLGVLFGVAVAAVSFAAALAAAFAARRMQPSSAASVRRARVLAFLAGAVVTAACLTYLTLWWRTANPGAEWSSPLWTSLALAVSAAISLILGHAVAVTALAVGLVGPARLSAPVPRTSWRASIIGSALAFGGAALLLLATAPADAPGERRTNPLPVRSSPRAVVLAIDGFDAALFEKARARQPEASGLFGVIESRVDLAAADSDDPARLWTTIATGVRPERHGVDSLQTRRVAGLQGRVGTRSIGDVIGGATDLLRLTSPSIASSFERRTKTFWEVAEQAGLRTAAVNWWATWPAAAASGTVISDRALLRLERGGPLDAEIAPSGLYDVLGGRWAEIRRMAEADAARLTGTSQDGGATLPADVSVVLRRSAELDATVMRVAQAIDGNPAFDLLVVYLPGLDIAQHTLLGGGGVPASQIEARVAALERYYSFLDSLTRGLIDAAAAQHHTLAVVAQPGRLHRGNGVMAVSGPAFQVRARGSGTVLDVAPTILHAVGVPVARDLDGRVVQQLFGPDYLARHPPRGVDTYGLRGAVSPARGSAPLDQEMIERLRSLGYVR
jgi:hypothetical protein